MDHISNFFDNNKTVDSMTKTPDIGAAAEGAETGESISAEVTPIPGEETTPKAGITEDVSTEEGKGEDKPAPFDTDPKYIEAKQAQERLATILKDNDYLSVEELETDLASGKTLQELLGSRDARQLIDNSDTLDGYKQQWAANKLAQEREGKTPNELVDILAKENEDLKASMAKDKETREARDKSSEGLQVFNNEINRVITAGGENLSDAAKSMAALFLGVDNPADDISDIGDVRAVRKMATAGLGKFTEFIKTIEQGAIDRYAAGKSNITPIPTPESETPTNVGRTERVVKSDMSTDQAFAKTGERFLANLQAAMKADEAT